MKFIIATLSLLILLALSGSMVGLVMGAGGYLPDLSSTPKEVPGGAMLRPHQATVPPS